MVKESPSSLAFSSPMKRKLLADLTTARATVKNKFKKAYMERMRRERELDKIFKPVTKKLASLTTDKKKKKKKGSAGEKKNEEEEESDAAAGNSSSDGSYYDDSLSDSAFDSSQFKTTNQEPHTPKSSSKRLSLLRPTPGSNIKWSPGLGTPKSNARLWGKDWRRSVLSDLLQQNQAVTTPFTPLRDTPATRKSILNPNTPTPSATNRSTNMRLMEPAAAPSTITYRRKEKKKLPLELKRLNTSLNHISMTPSSSKLRNVDMRGQFRHVYGDSLKSPSSSSKSKSSPPPPPPPPLESNFVPYTRNSRIVYEYFDDPNELCERLRLLTASRAAGNTNHAQEINSIVEELRELGHIY